MRSSGQRPVPGEIRRHPDTEYLVRPAGVPLREVSAEAIVLSETLQRHLDQLHAATRVASIGVFDGPEAFVLGEVGDVVLSGGRVYVLDVQAQDVRVFSTAGAHLATFGGPGEGPGELFRPKALTHRPDSETVWVADEGRRLSQFSFNDEAPRFDGTVKVDTGVTDVCFTAGTLVVHGLLVVEERGPLQRLTTAGEVTTVFGHQAYGSPSHSLNTLFNMRTKIACSRRSPLIFYGTNLGELRAHQADGELVWITALTDFIWPDARELRDGRYSMVRQARLNKLVGLTVLPDESSEALLVQVSLQEPGRETGGTWYEETRLDSYLIDPLTGEGGYVGSDLPLVVAARPGVVATLTDDGYPRISLLESGGF
jgi:hypothetical protein